VGIEIINGEARTLPQSFLHDVGVGKSKNRRSKLKPKKENDRKSNELKRGEQLES
jgi:hypothetical protein